MKTMVIYVEGVVPDQHQPEGSIAVADLDISHDEAEALTVMEKVRADDRQWLFPPEGGRLSVPVTSTDKRENFMLDVTRAQIKLTKATYQNRARQAIIYAA